MTKKFYITTTLPYVNAKPHVGHAMEFIRADILARYKRLMLGAENVFFNTGTDEHGLKNAEQAAEQGITPQEYCDQMVKTFYDLTKLFNISYDRFIRTTDSDHEEAAQEFWRIVDKNGHITKRQYQAKYCVGCETEKTDSELVNGECPDHPGKEIQLIDEENYFFLASNFSDNLLGYYATNPVLPDFRLNEIRSLIQLDGMRDFSISRLKEKMSWGVSVPGDDDHVMYVWFDALVNYISTLGWPGEGKFEEFWKEGTVFQICGKDNLRPQSAMWQAMLMAAGIKNTNKIYINGFVTSQGQKMSKTVGNVVDPIEVAEKYGSEAVRLFVTKHLHNFEDSDWTEERFHEAYTADLVNGLGNLVNRILAISEKSKIDIHTAEDKWEDLFELRTSGRFTGNRSIKTGSGGVDFIMKKPPHYIHYSEMRDRLIHSKSLEEYNFNQSIEDIFIEMRSIDDFITKTEVYRSDSEDRENNVMRLLLHLKNIAFSLQVFLPDSSEKIMKAIEENEKPKEPLFPRIEL